MISLLLLYRIPMLRQFERSGLRLTRQFTFRSLSSVGPVRDSLDSVNNTKIVTAEKLHTTGSPFSASELEAARLARDAAIGKLKFLPEKWIPYAELMRLEKPAGTLFLLIPSFWGITMASFSIGAPFLTFFSAVSLFSIGAVIMRGAGCTINDLLDRNLDNKVARTMERPITSGRVSVPEAVVFLAAQCFIGLGVLLSLPSDCLLLGALSLPFVASYPLFKRFTYYPQVVLSTCFSWGCLLGFPAVGAPLALWVSVPLYISNWIWCMTYDTVYAHQDKKFDVNAGIKSTALAWGDKTKPITYGLLTLQASAFALSGFMNGMGPGFYIGGIWGFYRLFRQLKEVNLDDPKSCWNFFTGNINTGFVFWFGMLFDYILKLGGFL